MGLGRNIPHMTLQKGGDRFNQTFPTWWLAPVVLSHCSELPRNSGLSCASWAVLFSATANAHISSSFSHRGFYPALTLKWYIKTLAAFYWDCTDTAKDVSCFGESWVQLEMVCTWAMMSSWKVLLLFRPFCLVVQPVGPHKAQTRESQEHLLLCCCHKVQVRRCWQWEIKHLSPSQYPDIPIWSFSCLLLHTSLDILHNQLHIRAWHCAGEQQERSAAAPSPPVAVAAKVWLMRRWTGAAWDPALVLLLAFQREFSFPPCSSSHPCVLFLGHCWAELGTASAGWWAVPGEVVVTF